MATLARMRPQLRAVAAAQGGVFTRRQALGVGYTETEIRHLSGRSWVMLRRGVYVERGVYDAIGSRDRDLALADRAGHLLVEKPHAMSHDSAARAWQLPMLRPDVDLVHLTRLGVGGSRTTAGVKHHLTRVCLPEQVEVDGMHLLGPARTVLDLAREHGLPTGVMACDVALRRGVTGRDLIDNLELMWSWPGVGSARAAFAMADAGAESAGESLMRIFVHELGIGVPTTQFPVVVDGRPYWCDLRVGCHLFEFDGFTKFLPEREGGVARESPSRVAWREKVRQDLVAGEGLGISRLVWDDMFGAARTRARARVLRQYQETVRKYGDQLPAHLLRNADRLARQRLLRQRSPWVQPQSLWPF